MYFTYRYFIDLFLLFVFHSCVFAAFELVPEEPWLEPGPSSTLFPHTAMVLVENPAALGLLEGSGLSVSASRPFGLRELDRAGISGCLISNRYAAGCVIIMSGDDIYSEMSLLTGVSWKVSNRFLAGVGAALRRVAISGYGHAMGFSMDAGLVYSPFNGVYGSAAMRGLIRTDLGKSGDPVVPLGFETALGICPVRKIRLGAGIRRDEGLDEEFSFMSSFSPAQLLEIGLSLRTDPSRFSIFLCLDISDFGLSYGYSGHQVLPSTHSVSVSWGENMASAPDPIEPAREINETMSEIMFPLNLNTATPEQLQTLPGIGPSKAQAIVAYRENHGGFIEVSEIEKVPGIGRNLTEQLREYLVVE